jgi:hypothetical protein
MVLLQICASRLGELGLHIYLQHSLRYSGKTSLACSLAHLAEFMMQVLVLCGASVVIERSELHELHKKVGHASHHSHNSLQGVSTLTRCSTSGGCVAAH